MAATIRVPRSRARLVEMVTLAKPQIISAYARPITNGAVEAAMKGLAGSRTAQITMPCIALAYVFENRDIRIWITYDERTNEEFNKEEISIVCLCWCWE